MPNRNIDSHTNNDNNQTHTVTLPILLGIKPVLYIPILYSIIVLTCIGAIMYFFLLSPKSGQYVHITSVPSGAAIFIDSVYYGTTPKKILQEKGSHTITLTLPFYTEFQSTYHTKNAFILRSILPKSIHATILPMEFTPELIHEPSIVSETIDQIAAWNITNSQTKRYIIPQVLTTTLTHLYEILESISTDTSDTIDEEYNILTIIHSILYESMPYLAVSKDNRSPSYQVQSWMNFYQTLIALDVYQTLVQKNQGNTDFISQQTQMEQFYQEQLTHSSISTTMHTPSPYSDTFPTQARSIILEKHYFYTSSQSHSFIPASPITQNSSMDPIQRYMEVVIDGITQTAPSSSVLQIHVPTFYVMNTEITQQQFMTFLSDNNMNIQEWKTHTQEKVSPIHKDTHFLDFDPIQHPNRPLRYITWYDAQAFVSWFNKKLKDTPYQAKLPNEYEWYAALQSYPREGVFDQDFDYIPTHYNGSTPILLGTLWEWGDSWYSPSPQYATYEGPLYGNEKHIFGGSYITHTHNAPLANPIQYSRNTAHSPYWATAYVGFRVIIVLR